MIFYLDNIEYQSYLNWGELTTKIKRDESLKTITVLHDTSLLLGDEAYSYLWNKLNTEGFCTKVSFESVDQCGFRIRGTIFLADVEFNERTCIASCKLEDNSYVSKIKNNQKIDTSLNHGKSKNGVTITNAPVYDIDYYTVSNNTYIQTSPAYRIYDALKYLVKFMSDDSLNFESNLFDLGGEYEGLAIALGKQIRDNTATEQPQINFEDLFNELNKRLNLILIVDDVFSSRPTIRIESANDGYTAGVIATHNNPYELITKCEVTKLYNQVSIGNSAINDDTIYSFPENIDYVGWKEESFFILSECNIDTELDLEVSYSVTSNMIQKCIGDAPLGLAPTDTYDENIFLIDTTVTGVNAGRTKNDNFLNLTPARYFYNYRLTNSETLARYIGGIPSTIAQYSNASGDGLFSATPFANYAFGLAPPYLFLATFDNTAYNTGGYYDAQDTYTAPTAGVYTFNTQVNFDLNGLAVGQFFVYARRYDSTNTLLETKVLYNSGIIQGIGYFPGPFIQFSSGQLSFNFILNSGDYVQIWYEGSSTLYGNILNTSYFTCVDNTIGGGIYQVYDPKDYPVYLYEYEYPVSSSEFMDMINNKIQSIQVNYNNLLRKGWIKEVSYDHLNSIAKIKLISSENAA